MNTLHYIILSVLFSLTVIARAEPWLASRFAQNCASCHAPGRVEVAAVKDRRCSFSCKSCHVNPNGGGLRNYYGKWNEERWLRSMYFANYKMNKPRPKPADQQAYEEKRLQKFISDIKDPKDLDRLSREGFRLAETTDPVSEHDYDWHSSPMQTVDEAQEANYRIPAGDPKRLTAASYFNAGVDFRWLYLNSKQNGITHNSMVPMATDVGASVQPTQHISAVWESRFLADPSTAAVWNDAYTSGAGVRSAYVMADDMPYNTYIMGGIYRPMFGNDNPDHTTLFAASSGLGEVVLDPNTGKPTNMPLTYQAVGVGTVGNFPFFNVNILEPFSNRAMPQDHGLVFNVGARFLKASSYIMLSWWDTKAKNFNTTVNTDLITSHRMQCITGGFTKGRLTFVGEITSMLIDVPNIRRDTGTVIGIEPRVRIWRESYIKGSGEYINTAPDLKLGSATEWGLGVGSFIASGVEFEIMYKDLKATEIGVASRESNAWAQLHLFF